MATSNILQSPPLFRGENYNYWAVKMKSFFLAHDLWEIVEEGFAPVEFADDTPVEELRKQKESSKKNFKALSFLYSAVSEAIFPRIVSATTAKEAWDTL